MNRFQVTRAANLLGYRLFPKVTNADARRFRDHLKYQCRLYPVQERLEYPTHREPIKPWAFIRAYNEISTIEASLNSILPLIQNGVIAYNDCNDGTAEFIQKFCQKHPGFIPFHYPFQVFPSNSEEYKNKNLNYKNTLAAYYNAALSFIPRGEWVIKIDCDLVFFEEPLKWSLSLPQRDTDFVSFSRMDLAVINNEIRFIRYSRPNDHFLIKNDGFYFRNDSGYLPDGRFWAWEVLVRKPSRFIFPECSCLHFPFHKEWRPIPDYVKTYDLNSSLSSISKLEISEEFFNKNNIQSIVDSFKPINSNL